LQLRADKTRAISRIHFCIRRYRTKCREAAPSLRHRIALRPEFGIHLPDLRSRDAIESYTRSRICWSGSREQSQLEYPCSSESTDVAFVPVASRLQA